MVALTRLTLVALSVGAALMPRTAEACGLEGRASRTDGSKVDATAKISTSWNEVVAYPRSGAYSLELGAAACGEAVEVFVNGYSLGRTKLQSSGNATLNFVLEGSTDRPVRTTR